MAPCPMRVTLTHAPATTSIIHGMHGSNGSLRIGSDHPNPKRESIHSAFVRNVFAACSVTELISIEMTENGV